jgi:hypothetical protein
VKVQIRATVKRVKKMTYAETLCGATKRVKRSTAAHANDAIAIEV